jgi:hypothetical protein
MSDTRQQRARVIATLYTHSVVAHSLGQQQSDILCHINTLLVIVLVVRGDCCSLTCIGGVNIEDLVEWIDCIAGAFVNLKYLSMLKNPACPNPLTGASNQDYLSYRYVIVTCCPHVVRVVVRVVVVYHHH